MEKQQSRAIPVKTLHKKFLQPTKTLQHIQKYQYIGISSIFHSPKAPFSYGIAQVDYEVFASHA